MKFAEKIFPIGTFSDQRTDGAYIDETLASNLDVYAEKITKDMTFTIILSGNDSVGNGKSSCATQIACYLTWKINQLHKVNNNFTSKNVVMNGTKLPERSLELPAYSVILLDEGDDLTQNWMKETTQSLKRYFRKCRQLNQILILILPSFFELPKFYALSRSHCLINVKFQDRFERGYLDFYGPRRKKYLYLKGKRDWDYDVCKPDFSSRFFGSYCFFPDCKIETELYKKMKYQDMVDDTKDKRTKPEHQLRKEISVQIFRRLYQNLDKIRVKDLALAFGVSERTGNRWLSKEYDRMCAPVQTESDNQTQNVINLIERDDLDDENGELED